MLNTAVALIYVVRMCDSGENDERTTVEYSHKYMGQRSEMMGSL
jgi:hypothetical protein